MRSSRQRFRPGFDHCEARLLMAGDATSTGVTTNNPSSPIGPPPIGTSSATANPILYAYSKAFLSHIGQANYNPAVDTNHSGYIGRKDAFALLKAVTPFARRGPLYLTLSLAPGEQANTPHPADSGGVTRNPSFVTIVGHTIPNSLVFTDDTNNDFLFRGGTAIAVNAQGWFTDTVLVTGPYKLSQHNFFVITPSLQSIRRAFPVLQLVKPVKLPSTPASSTTGTSASGTPGANGTKS